MFRHPSYYKNLRKLARNRELQEIVDGIAASATDQAISLKAHDGERERAPGPGLKLQAASAKQQASSVTPQAPEASSDKRQAPSSKRQA